MCQWTILTGDQSDIIVTFLTFVIYTYRISLVIRQVFFFFQNNSKDLDPSYKTDLDLRDSLGRVNSLYPNFTGLIHLFVVILKKGKSRLIPK